MAQESWVQSQVESHRRLEKCYLMPPCLTLSIMRYGSRVKWSNPGKGIAPSSTPWCSSYRKGSLRVTPDYGRQLNFTLLVHLCSTTRIVMVLNNPQRLICQVVHTHGICQKVYTFQRTVWHPCRTVNAPWQTWGQKAPGFSFGWVTFKWVSCIIDIFATLVYHWTLLSSLSYNQAYVPRPRFGSMSSKAHQAHIALSGTMTRIVSQGLSLGSCPPSPSPKSPL